MYLHLGKGTIVSTDSIVGIFDLDITSQSHLTRRYLAMAEKAGRVADVSGELPKSFVLTESGGKRTLWLSQLNSSTLLKRWDSETFGEG